MFIRSRRIFSSFFYRFISLFLICTMFIFLNLNIERKKVKAIEPVTLTYSMYLLIGGLATMCGIKFASIPKEARYDFISGAFESVKNFADWTMDDRGNVTKLLLNENVVRAFLEYVNTKESSSLDVFIPGDVVSPVSNSYSLSCYLPFTVADYDSNLSTGVLLGSFEIFSTVDSISFNGQSSYGSFSPGIYYLYTVTCPPSLSDGGTNYLVLTDALCPVVFNPHVSYPDCFLWIACRGLCPSVINSFVISASGGSLGDFTFTDLNSTVFYPQSLTDVRGIEDYTEQWDKTNVGQQSIEVDGTKTSVDIATPIDSSDTFANDIIFPAGIEEGIKVPGLKINSGEGSIESAPDLSEDETLEHQGILQKVLDWLGSLVLDLMDFLLNLLDKLIDMLKSLLISLFVPTVSVADIGDLILDRLSVPIFSAPGEFSNKEPLTFTFPYVVPGVDETDIVITLDQPWFPIIRELFLGFICYLLILFAYRKFSSLYGSD